MSQCVPEVCSPCTSSVSLYPDIVGRFPQVSGIRFIFDPKETPRVKDLWVGDRPRQNFSGSEGSERMDRCRGLFRGNLERLERREKGPQHRSIRSIRGRNFSKSGGSGRRICLRFTPPLIQSNLPTTHPNRP